MIQSNLDNKLSPAEIAKHEKAERRKGFIDDRVKQAEKDEREGSGSADIVYSGLQRDNVYTANPSLDNDPTFVARMYAQRKSLPVKQREIGPDGTWVLVVAPEFQKALAQRLWCHNCEEAQPDNDIEWMAAVRRLEERIGPKPGWACHREMCPYCGARLGFNGYSNPDEDSSLLNMTPEQLKMLEEICGPMKAE